MPSPTREVTDSSFPTDVLQATQPVLVDFWGSNCTGCRIIAPFIEEIAAQYDGRAVVAKINVTQNQEYAAQLGVTAIPTLLIFKSGKVVGRIVGAVPKDQITRALEPHL